MGGPFRRVFAYLTKTRKIDPEIVQTMMKQAKVYQSRQEIGGKVRRNCAFVGYDSKGTPRYCALRGPSAGSSFRQDMENSDKTYGFLMEGKSNRVYEFEAPIDAMSHATLYKLVWRPYTLMTDNASSLLLPLPDRDCEVYRLQVSHPHHCHSRTRFH